MFSTTPPPTWAASAVSAWSFQSFRPTCEVKLGRFEGIQKQNPGFSAYQSSPGPIFFGSPVHESPVYAKMVWKTRCSYM